MLKFVNFIFLLEKTFKKMQFAKIHNKYTIIFNQIY